MVAEKKSPVAMEHEKKKEQYLFIWSRGGGGHKAVMDAKRQELEEKGDYEFIELDMMGEEFLNSLIFPVVGKMGDFSVNMWNEAQKAGDVRKQRTVSNLQWLAEIVFTPIVYRRMLKFLLTLEAPLKGIIVTQALCNAAIARAIAVVNRKRNWNMKLDLWMSDLPTEKAVHFFYSIRKIGKSKKLSDLVTIYSPPPYAQSDLGKEKEYDWWVKRVGKANVITDKPYPIRKAFLDQPSLIGQAVELKLKGTADEPLCFHIEAKDKVATLMLGSQPSIKAVLDYVDVMIKLARDEEKIRKRQNVSSDSRYYFFAFCGTGSAKDFLIQEVKKRISSGDFPLFLTIIPFSLQSDSELAPILARSDVTVTRSGGATSMELMHLNRDRKGLTLIHSEASTGEKDKFWNTLVEKLQTLHSKKDSKAEDKPSASSYKRSLRSFLNAFSGQFSISPGIFLWEEGNAEYLKQKIEAKIVTPKHVESILQKLFFCGSNRMSMQKNGRKVS